MRDGVALARGSSGRPLTLGACPETVTPMAKKDERSRSSPKPALPGGAVLIWVALGVQLLTFCGGKTDEQTGQSGTGGQGTSGAFGGDGYAGHTAECLRSGNCPGFPGYDGSGGQGDFGGGGFAGHTAGCIGTCGGPCGPCGGFGGEAGQSGSTGGGGFVGFGGHTAGCLGKCGDGCPPCAPGGNNSDGGDAAAIEGGIAIRDARSAEAMTNAAPQSITPFSCYVLSGYEPDPCLPADDSLLPWLTNVPNGCPPHVVSGPFAGNDESGRTCCYSVACE
jgi:hypothetical protein